MIAIGARTGMLTVTETVMALMNLFLSREQPIHLDGDGDGPAGNEGHGQSPGTHHEECSCRKPIYLRGEDGDGDGCDADCYWRW